MTAAVITLSPEAPFVDTLASGLWEAAGGDPLELAAGTLYLPTRRACRHVRGAFLRLADGKAALLPRLVALSDADEDDLIFADTDLSPDIPPAIDPMRRRLILTRLVQKKDPAMPVDQALDLAEALARLLDEMHTAQVSFDALETLVQGENLARHWQETLVFLQIVTKEWPHILEDEGAMDPALRRNALVAARLQLWEQAPPAFPVTIAGADGSVPSVAALMRCIAGMPKGRVILPGLDQALPREAWQAIEEGHPQHSMKQFLESLSLDRADVGVWGPRTEKPRTRLLQEAMRPASVSEGWGALKEKGWTPKDCAGLERIELPNQQMEAEVIALRLRAALEEPGKVAALVTPDRALSMRVIAALARYGIDADDSAGAALSVLPIGRFLSEVLAAAMPDPSPVAMLALLKHPLAACGVSRVLCRARARQAEKAVWRGVRLTRGWIGAAEACLRLAADKDKDDLATLALWLQTIGAWFASFADHGNERPLADWIAAHVKLAETMAATDETPGAEALWRGEAGEAAARFLSDLARAGRDLPPMGLASYARLVGHLMKGITVRPLYGQHPRLLIQGPLEARLSQPDLIVLGGLNDGVFPRAAPPDPWLSRPMRQALGLPLPERILGLSAHDFVQLAAAPHVLMTRARRSGGADVVPSRFWLQLDAVMRLAFGLDGSAPDPLTPALPWAAWAMQRDIPARVQGMTRPRPCPPVEARPTVLGVTDIGLLQRNPYAIYAKHILRLRPLDPIDADVTAAQYGSGLHAALENFMRERTGDLPPEALEQLIDQCRAALKDFSDRPMVAAYWMPRFEDIARWFVANERARRAEGYVPLAQEASGQLVVAGGALTLKGRADRIDRMPDGRLEIIDYKTGTPPTKNNVRLGIDPQLVLLALMARAGVFGEAFTAPVGQLSYWSLKGRGKNESAALDINLDVAIDAAGRFLTALVARYADPASTYDAVPRPAYQPAYDDYADLSRVQEWQKS